MEASEHETIILINDADVKEGFFRFSTSKISDFNRLVRRVKGEENLVSVSKHVQGKMVTNFIVCVPIRFLSKTWAIGVKRKGNAQAFKKDANQNSDS